MLQRYKFPRILPSNGLQAPARAVRSLKRAVMMGSLLFGIALHSVAQTGEALDFDGSDYIDNVGTPIPAGSAYTKEAWIYATNTGGAHNIISGDPSSNATFWIYTGLFRASNSIASTFTDVFDPIPVPTSTWIHYAVTYDPLTTTMTLYKNGALIASNTSVAPAPAQYIELGRFSTANNFSGIMDEVRIWTRALSAAEISTNWNKTLTTPQTNLVRYYKFNQGIAGGNNAGVTTATDATGTQDGTLQTFVLSGMTSNWVAPGAPITNLVNTVTNTTTNQTYATIQAAVDAATNGDTLNVGAGIYAENVTVDKSVTILGPNAGINPCSGIRGTEAIIVPATNDVLSGEIFHVAASNVTISGFILDGDNPSLPANGYGTTGADMHAAEGIAEIGAAISNLTVTNNIIRNLSDCGVILYHSNTGTPTSGHTITNNKFQDLGTYDSTSGADYWGIGVLLYNNQYAQVDNNCMDNVRIGVQTGNNSQANPGAATSQSISNNTMTNVRTLGIFHNLQYGTASPLTISGNSITGVSNANETYCEGMLLASLSVSSAISNNTINLAAVAAAEEVYGYDVWNVASATPAAISGGSVTGADIGVFVNNYDGYGSDAPFGGHASLAGTTITPNASGMGIRVYDNPAATSNANVQLSIGAGVQVNGGVDGLVIENETASVPALGSATFTLQTGNYIRLAGGAMNNADLDASSNSFDGVTGSAVTAVQGFTIEDKITHEIDNAAVGFVIVKPSNVYVTDIAPLTPTATNNDYSRVKNGVEAAGNGFTINHSGTFDWTETNAAAAWALGNDGLNNTADDYSVLPPANLNGVTFTAPLGLNTATITGPGDLPGVNLEGALYFDGSGDNQNWTISNMVFSGFDLSVGMFYDNGGGADGYNGTTIDNNIFNIPTDLNAGAAPADVNQNIGLHFAHGASQTISNNVFNIPGNGVSTSTANATSVAMQSNTSGGAVYNGLAITGNTINVQNAQSSPLGEVILGIWENAHAHSSNIAVSNNSFLSTATGNNPALNRQRAFRVTSHSSASTTVTYSNNTVQGANTGFQWLPGGGFAGNAAVQLSANTVSGCDTGVLVQAGGVANLQNDFVQNGNQGIFIRDASTVTANNNDLSGASNKSINNTGSVTANATCNWYGSAASASVAALISGPVNYVPFLTSGTDAAPATPGFQPGGTCNGDTTAPVFTSCPTNITGISNVCGRVVTYAMPTATDANGPVTPVMTAGLASGSVFPMGTTTVTYTATDASNNTSTCTFTVTVTGTAPNATQINVVPANSVYTGGNSKNMYLGYGSQTATFQVTASGGSGFTYSWAPATYLSNPNVANPVFTPTVAGNFTYTVTITNSTGCTVMRSVTMCVKDIRVPGAVPPKGYAKVYVCTETGTQQIPTNQVTAHIFAGMASTPHSADRLGRCEDAPCGSNPLVRSIAGRDLPGGDDLVSGEHLTMVLYPNPSTDQFTLRIESTTGGQADVRILDMSGRVMQRLPGTSMNAEVTLGRELAPGVYFVEVRSGEEVKMIKVVKL